MVFPVCFIIFCLFYYFLFRSVVFVLFCTVQHDALLQFSLFLTGLPTGSVLSGSVLHCSILLISRVLYMLSLALLFLAWTGLFCLLNSVLTCSVIICYILICSNLSKDGLPGAPGCYTKDLTWAKMASLVPPGAIPSICSNLSKDGLPGAPGCYTKDLF